MNALIDALHRSPFIPPHSSSSQAENLSSHHQPLLLQGVLESMMDGVLVLTDQGQLIYANHCAQQLFQHLVEGQSQSNSVPPQIWCICRSLVENRELFSDHSILIEDEITTQKLDVIRVRVRWLELNQDRFSYLLVTLEDRDRSTQNVAIAEALKYGLTEREAEVWQLRRANHSYKAIASKLHIALDTVKKHVKNIHAKRESALWE